MSMSVNVYAETTFYKAVDNIEIIAYEQSILNEMASTPTPDGIAATELESEQKKSDPKQRNVLPNTLTPLFIRQADDSTVVQVYLTYAGTTPASAVKFNEMTIQSTSLLFQQTYGSLTAKVYDFQMSYLFYNQPIGVVDIPVGVKKVRVQDSEMMVYYMDPTNPGWNSFTNIMGEWPIQ